MEAGQARIDRMEPRIAEAVTDPDLAVRGTQSIREVMVATEVEVASMLARVDEDVARLIAEADSSARARVSDRREQLAGVRRELALWAAAVGQGFQNLLDLLDEADARMAEPEPEPLQAAPPPPIPRAPAEVPAEPPRLRLAESPAPAVTGDGRAAAEESGHSPSGGAEGRSRRRWWRRWFRQAA